MEQQFQESGNSVRASPGAAAIDPEAGSGRGTTAIDRGAELLLRVLESEQPVALTELASASGIPKSTASRLLSALERQGLVEQEGERGRLRPGPAILRVAERGMLERSLTDLAQPSLDALAAQTGETINLAVPGVGGVEHLAQVDSRHFLGAGQWLGRRVAYHNTAVGKVFIAFGRAGRAEPAGSATVPSLGRPGELEQIRREDFAAAIDELEPGLAAVAAPVRGPSGAVIAALSVSGPTMRMTPERIVELKPALVEEARALSRRLGRPAPTHRSSAPTQREPGENAA